MTQQTETKVSRAYDGGIIILGALLLIAVIVGAVYLLSVAINDAPVVSAIFGILFVLFCVGSVIGYAAQTRWAITQNANVHIQVANSLGQALAQYKSQAPQTPMLYAPPAPRQIADVRRVFNGGLPPGVSGARVSDGATEYEATTAALTAALDLLSEGKDPTRSNFKSKGIMSSTEASGAVNLLASLGYIEPIVQGAPAEWAANVVPSDVASIADHLRQDVPALPVYQPVFAETAQQAGQAGSKAGRGGAKRR
jgi:hypothetical protein